MAPLNVTVIFGTRPEAVKLVSLILELRKRAEFDVKVLITAQHREMLDPILEHFSIRPDRDLDLMRPNQTLFEITARAITELEVPLMDFKPGVVLVQGDTTTAFAGALAAFYLKIPVGHVEAGLRTGDRYSPFPEEMNRLMTTRLASLNFCPTEQARQNLLKENVDPSTIHVTGNTGIDTLLQVAASPGPLPEIIGRLNPEKKLVLLTLHRRESFGEPIRRALQTIGNVAEERGDIEIVYPVHMNPNVRGPAEEILGGRHGVLLIPPVEYIPFVSLLKRADLILTDSGGIQEEAPSLEVPVLVLREVTERQEAIEAGTAILVGADPIKIRREMTRLLDNPDERRRMTGVANPFGDGRACRRIADILVVKYGTTGG